VLPKAGIDTTPDGVCPLRSGNHDLGDIGGGAIVDGAGAGHCRVGGDRAHAGPVVAAHAGLFEDLFAERIRRRTAILRRSRRRRCERRRQVGRGDGRNAAHIVDQRANIGWRHLAETLVDGFAHGVPRPSACPVAR
jgi:hypothetical protein